LQPNQIVIDDPDFDLLFWGGADGVKRFTMGAIVASSIS
jgi:hypothetical protein